LWYRRGRGIARKGCRKGLMYKEEQGNMKNKGNETYMEKSRHKHPRGGSLQAARRKRRSGTTGCRICPSGTGARSAWQVVRRTGRICNVIMLS